MAYAESHTRVAGVSPANASGRQPPCWPSSLLHSSTAAASPSRSTPITNGPAGIATIDSRGRCFRCARPVEASLAARVAKIRIQPTGNILALLRLEALIGGRTERGGELGEALVGCAARLGPARPPRLEPRLAPVAAPRVTILVAARQPAPSLQVPWARVARLGLAHRD